MLETLISMGSDNFTVQGVMFNITVISFTTYAF